MQYSVKKLAGLVALLAAGTAYAGDEAAAIINDGTVALNLRYRFEAVDQDNIQRNAKANILRTRVTATSGAWRGWTAQAEVDNLWSMGSGSYNSTENGNTQYPVIADPEGTDLNQLWLKYTGKSGDATAGRQRINLGTQRFVGGVGWRQNEQTFDGLRAHWKPTDALQLDLSYIYNVNRIFGPDDGANPADLQGDNYLFRGDYQLNAQHKLAAFAYLLDIDDDGPFPAGKTVNNSSDTYGVEYQGTFGAWSVFAAYATQSDAGSSQLNYDADYYKVELGTALGPIKLKGGYEVLGSDNGVGFKTPLATLHAFQGWADKFLATPGDGIEDLYVSAGGNMGPIKLGAVYHDFQAESSTEDFGKELDLVGTWPVRKNLKLQLFYADFQSDSNRLDDTQKFWVMVTMNI